MADPVRPLVVVAALEALAAAGMFISVLVAVITGAGRGLSGAGTGTSVVELAIFGLILLGLVAVWLGLYRRRRAARTPFLMVQAFVLLLVPMFLGSDVAVYHGAGVAVGIVAVLGLVLGLRPAVGRRLG